MIYTNIKLVKNEEIEPCKHHHWEYSPDYNAEELIQECKICKRIEKVQQREFLNGDIIIFEDGFAILYNDTGSVVDGYEPTSITDLSGEFAGMLVPYSYEPTCLLRYIEKHGSISKVENIVDLYGTGRHYMR